MGVGEAFDLPLRVAGVTWAVVMGLGGPVLLFTLRVAFWAVDIIRGYHYPCVCYDA